ncbi:phosphoribosylformylglycinamidine cyclo-ligase [Edaphobacter modestus]|uniref:Phosphoribosylformylglycinamidine cyclo-ligase n=2 Tax=Edaphobacter modestus TaxID=388466 RepID=A0A4Q7YWI2_9BACT|nr:phosphoribosylformylglycinamidine cyclo-ligase [Edaphobacter modestus]
MPETFPTTDATTPDSTRQKQEATSGSKLQTTAAQKNAIKKPMPAPGKRAISYADAGVDISAADKSKHRIKMLARKTFNKHVLSEIGGFGGLFSLDLEKYPNPVLVSSADGVGTKLKVAFDLGIHHTVGQDLVNHCVNDIAVQGATPLFFLDYLATGKLENSIVETVVQGISDACRANGCALIGGETAQMPGFYSDGEYDLAGTIIGAVSRDRIITGEGIQVGDILLGLPSNGLHTNGYSLARKLLFEEAKYGPEQYVNELKDKTGAALMRIHRSYLAIIKKLTAADLVSGMAHITGGGITENLPRILTKGMGAQVDLATWQVPPLFEHLQKLGNVEQDEMLRTFNMGIGLIAVIPAEKVKKAKAILNRANERHSIIGRIVRGERKVSYN